MGYYITLATSTFGIPNQNLEEAYRIMCALNERDDLKSGGTYGPQGLQSRHFSWMDGDYPRTCGDAEAIFRALGFETLHNDTGLYLTEYDSKMGDEEHFLDAVGHLAFPESEMEWSGEDGARWRWTPTQGTQQGTVVYGTRVQDAVPEPEEQPTASAEALLRIAEAAYQKGLADARPLFFRH